MLPPPQSLHNRIMIPLQNWATTSAVFLLEMLGYFVTTEGNIIHLNGDSVAVAEACNGLRMVTAFLIITALIVLLINRPWWQKLIVVILSLPIALFCNAIRLTLTAIIFTSLGKENWEMAFHDFGGYAMMPLALGMIIFTLWFLAKLESQPKSPTPTPTQNIIFHKS